jgi:thioredoxin reductase (NADPH)
MDDTQQQALACGAEFLSAEIDSVDLSKRPFVLKAGTETIEADALIIACGAKAKLLGLPGETELMGHGLSVCATCDGFFFKNKKVFVVGGGDSALSEAMDLTAHAASVTVIHRRDQFKASKIMIDRAMKTEKLDFILDSVVEGLTAAEAGTLSGITVRNVKTGAVQHLATDGLFIAIGHTPNTAIFRDQLQMNERGYLEVNGVFTSIEGVFAAGDVCDEEFRQAVYAAGMGCAAAMKAQRFLAATTSASEAQPAETATTPAELPANESERTPDPVVAETQPAEEKPMADKPHATVVVTAETFEAVVLKSPIPVIVDFWAEWCGPCRAIEAKIEALAAEYKGRLVIAKWNVDDSPGAGERFNVRSIPQLIVYKDGREIKRLRGQEPLQFLKHEFDDLIGVQDTPSDAAKALRTELDATMKAALEQLGQARQRCWQDVEAKLPPELVKAENEASAPLEQEVDRRLGELKAQHDRGEVTDDAYWPARIKCMREVDADPAFAELVKTRDAAREKVGEALDPLYPEYEAALARCEDQYNAQVAAARVRFKNALEKLRTEGVPPPANERVAPVSPKPAAAKNWFTSFMAWLDKFLDSIFP